MNVYLKRAAAVACAIAFFAVLSACRSPRTDQPADPAGEGTDEDYGIAAPDPDEYYSQNGKILTKTDAAASDAVLSEAEAAELLQSRGFDQTTATADFSMSGDYLGEMEIDETSSEKHPMYQTFFCSGTGEIWIISVIENELLAEPVSFNEESGLDAPVIVSESKTVTSYDAVTNRFYRTEPKETAVILKQVKRITAETLNGLTREELNEP